MFLFLIASGLSLIFGVLRVLNFAHGTFYMLGAYSTYQIIQWLGPGPGMFWVAAVGAALGIALLGGVVERFLFRHLYGKEELYQLLFTYALVLVLSDAAKIIWGTQQKSVSRPPGLAGSVSLWGATIPYYNLFILLLGPAIALAFWFVLQRTRTGRVMRAAALDRETLGALGQPTTRSRYYHQYLNGQYWGLYETQERPEASYGSTYLGGSKEDYDVVKCSNHIGAFVTEVTDGNLDAFRLLWTMARAVAANPPS